MLLYKKGGKIHGNSAVPEFIKPYMVLSTKRKNGKFLGLTKPEHLSNCGCSLGADEDGFFLYTHRGRSKSRKDLNFTQKEIKFVESTG